MESFQSVSEGLHLLVHHVLNALLDLGEGGRLAAVVQHGHHRVHAPEHLGQHLVLVGQGEAWGHVLGEGVVLLIRWLLRTEGERGQTAADLNSVQIKLQLLKTDHQTLTCLWLLPRSAWAPLPPSPPPSSELWLRAL